MEKVDMDTRRSGGIPPSGLQEKTAEVLVGGTKSDDKAMPPRSSVGHQTTTNPPSQGAAVEVVALGGDSKPGATEDSITTPTLGAVRCDGGPEPAKVAKGLRNNSNHSSGAGSRPVANSAAAPTVGAVRCDGKPEPAKVAKGLRNQSNHSSGEGSRPVANSTEAPTAGAVRCDGKPEPTKVAKGLRNTSSHSQDSSADVAAGPKNGARASTVAHRGLRKKMDRLNQNQTEQMEVQPVQQGSTSSLKIGAQRGLRAKSQKMLVQPTQQESSGSLNSGIQRGLRAKSQMMRAATSTTTDADELISDILTMIDKSEAFTNVPYSGEVVQTENVLAPGELAEARLVVENPEDLEVADEVDPADLEQKELQQQQDRRKRKALLAAIGISFVIFVVVLGTVLGTRKQSETIPSTPSPTFSQAPSETPSASPSYSIVSIFADSLPGYTQKSFQDPDSSQSRALRWLSSHRDITTMPEWRMRQIFVLVTFYFAFRGDEWAGVLTDDWLDDTRSECEWFSLLFGGFVNGTTYQEAEDPSAGPCNDAGEFEIMLYRGLARILPLPLEPASMPPEIALLTTLRIMILQATNYKDTTLQDILPPELFHLPNLEVLDLNQNSLPGTLPTELGLLSKLSRLNMWENQLTGTIPTQLAFLTGLKSLDFDNNMLQGQIPTEFEALEHLELLCLMNNQLSGNIPSTLGLITALKYLRLNDNELAGSIPSELTMCTDMTYLWLGGNALVGTIPDDFRSLTHMTLFNVSKTFLIGPLPAEMEENASLGLVDVTGTSLTGRLPVEICSLAQDSCNFTVQNLYGMPYGDYDQDCELNFDCSDFFCGCGCDCPMP